MLKIVMKTEEPRPQSLMQTASIEELIEEARNGRIFILVDDNDRENEGDLVLPAQMVTPDAINFMAKYGRGLICLPMTGERVRQLGLPLMTGDNKARHQTAFTVAIEAREGVTTGISAADRAHTIQVAIDPNKDGRDIVSPGHVFPLMARDGGVLMRAGHTEAAVDIARLAGLNPSAVICEIMNDDGTMARMPDLVKFAETHGLKIGTIADLIAYRRRKDTLVTCVREEPLVSEYGGEWSVRLFVNRTEGTEHLALVKGDITTGGPILVRMHNLSFLDDALGRKGPRSKQLNASMREIAAEGRGAVIIIRHTHSGDFSELLDQPFVSISDAGDNRVIRDYGVGAQILIELGIRELILLTNSPATKLSAFEGYGVQITGMRPITMTA